MHTILDLITKSMTYRAFYYKIQISVNPEKNFVILGEGLTCETLENMKVVAFLNVSVEVTF